jgi:hypothetical protein
MADGDGGVLEDVAAQFARLDRSVAWLLGILSTRRQRIIFSPVK